MDAETKICFPKFTSKEATSPLERCDGAMLSERHKWLTSRCGGSMLTQRHTRPHPGCGSTQLTNSTKGSPYSPKCAPQKAGTRSTMGRLRAVTEPVQDWDSLHNSIGGSQQHSHKRLQCHKRPTTPQKATRPQKVNKTTKGQQSNHTTV